MIYGSCLCGSVTYEADCDNGPILHCHCQTCRKAHSAAFSTVMPIAFDAFKWTSGEDLLSISNHRRAKTAISVRAVDRS